MRSQGHSRTRPVASTPLLLSTAAERRRDITTPMLHVSRRGLQGKSFDGNWYPVRHELLEAESEEQLMIRQHY